MNEIVAMLPPVSSKVQVFLNPWAIVIWLSCGKQQAVVEVECSTGCCRDAKQHEFTKLF